MNGWSRTLARGFSSSPFIRTRGEGGVQRPAMEHPGIEQVCPEATPQGPRGPGPAAPASTCVSAPTLSWLRTACPHTGLPPPNDLLIPRVDDKLVRPETLERRDVAAQNRETHLVVECAHNCAVGCTSLTLASGREHSTTRAAQPLP